MACIEVKGELAPYELLEDQILGIGVQGLELLEEHRKGGYGALACPEDRLLPPRDSPRAFPMPTRSLAPGGESW
jgi:hypothetical protein